jgi:hypothetical protein
VIVLAGPSRPEASAENTIRSKAAAVSRESFVGVRLARTLKMPAARNAMSAAIRRCPASWHVMAGGSGPSIPSRLGISTGSGSLDDSQGGAIAGFVAQQALSAFQKDRHTIVIQPGRGLSARLPASSETDTVRRGHHHQACRGQAARER